MKVYEKNFLRRLIEMYGKDYAGLFYKEKVGMKPTEEMFNEVEVKEELPTFNLNEL